MGRRAQRIPSWPGVIHSNKGRIHLRRPTCDILTFRLRRSGGPYIPYGRRPRRREKSPTAGRRFCPEEGGRSPVGLPFQGPFRLPVQLLPEVATHPPVWVMIERSDAPAMAALVACPAGID